MKKLSVLLVFILISFSVQAGEALTSWRWNLVHELTPTDEPYNTGDAKLLLECDNGFTRELPIESTSYTEVLDPGTYSCYFRVELAYNGEVLYSKNSIVTQKIVDGVIPDPGITPKTATNIEVK